MDVIALAKINALKKSGGVGYSEPSWQEVVPQQSVNVAYMEEMESVCGTFNCEATFKNGDKVKVIFDGVPYECSYVDIENFAQYIGNGSLVGLEDTGEPFVIFPFAEPSIVICEEGTHTLSISTETETIHTIDPKFLPSGGVGGIQTIALNTVLSDTVDTMDLTEEESALFFEASQSNKMIYVDCTINPQILGGEMKVVSPLSRLTMEGIVIYFCSLNAVGTNISIAFQKSETAENRFSATLAVTA